MTSILDHIKISDFQPRSTSEYLALQLARKLADTERLHEYVRFVTESPRDLLVRAFQRSHKDIDMSESFRRALQALNMSEL